MKKLAILLITSLLAACGGGSSSTDPVVLPEKPGRSTVEFDFTAVAGGTLGIKCATGYMPNGTNGTFHDFAFYAHDFRLVTDEGVEIPLRLAQTDWQYRGVALIDFQDLQDSCSGPSGKATNTRILASVSDDAVAGRVISGIRFVLGVPAELNHQDKSRAPSPLNRIDLQWGWQAGYKFARMDFAPDAMVSRPGETPDSATWNFHLGSTGCACEGGACNPETEMTCAAENRAEIDLSLVGLDLADIAIQVDYQQLVMNEILTQDAGGAPGCMSGAIDPECASTFDALGLGIDGQDDPNPGQTVFSIIDKTAP